MNDSIDGIHVIRKIMYGDKTLEPFSDKSFVYIPFVFSNSEPVYMKIPKELFKYERHK